MGLYSWLRGGNDGRKANEDSTTKNSPADSAAHRGTRDVAGNAIPARAEDKNGNTSAGNGKKPRWPKKLITKLKKALNTLSRLIQKQGKKIEEDHRELRDRLSRLEKQYFHVGQLVAGMAERQQTHHAREASYRKQAGAYREQAGKVLEDLRERVDGLGDRIDEQAGEREPGDDEFRRKVLHLLENTRDSVQDLRPEDRLFLEISNDISQLDQTISNLQEKTENYPSGCSASEQLEDVVSTLQGLRTNLVSILRSNGARPIEQMEDFDSRFHEPASERRRRPDGASGDGEVLRPGLLMEENGRTRTLRPARVVLYEDVEL